MSQKRRHFPYYKVEFFNEDLQAWQDIGRGRIFDSAESAKEYIERDTTQRKARIIIVERTSRRVLDFNS
jgi:hypothetical protein